jgi:hypothetical protein
MMENDPCPDALVAASRFRLTAIGTRLRLGLPPHRSPATINMANLMTAMSVFVGLRHWVGAPTRRLVHRRPPACHNVPCICVWVPMR